MYNETKIWSLRWSPSYGSHWLCERICIEMNAESWIKEFEKDDPNVLFVSSVKKPKLKKEHEKLAMHYAPIIKEF